MSRRVRTGLATAALLLAGIAVPPPAGARADGAELDDALAAPAPAAEVLAPSPALDAATGGGPGVERAPTSSMVTTVAEGDEAATGDTTVVVRLVMALLVVVGLLVATLTARYWWYTNPKRGLAPSRAVLPRGAVWEDEAPSDPTVEAQYRAEDVLDPSFVVHGELVGAAAPGDGSTRSARGWPADVGVAAAPPQPALPGPEARTDTSVDVEPVPVALPAGRPRAGLWARDSGANGNGNGNGNGQPPARGRPAGAGPGGEAAAPGGAEASPPAEATTVRVADVLAWVDAPGDSRRPE